MEKAKIEENVHRPDNDGDRHAVTTQEYIGALIKWGLVDQKISIPTRKRSGQIKVTSAFCRAGCFFSLQ